MHTSVVSRLTNGRAVSANTLAKLRNKIKTEEDFATIPSLTRRPRSRRPVYGWTLDSIRDARDAQVAGNFRVAAPLSVAMRFDDAIFVAYHNRIAPILALSTTLRSAGGVRGDAIQKRASSSVTVPHGVVAALVGTMATHGVAFGYVEHEVDEDAEHVSMALTEWPIEHIRWDDQRSCYMAMTDEGVEVAVNHGDSRWIVFSKFSVKPFQQEACLIPSAMIFAAHIDAIKDWAAASRSHGQAKIMGMLPEGVPMREGDSETLSPEADSFLVMLQDFVSGEIGAGLKPHGSEAAFISNGSSAWNVFDSLAVNREKAAARVWLGNDGSLGSVGGAPGVDIAELFGVATTKVEGDVGAIERGLYDGLYVPWCAINYGDSKHAPRLTFDMPDADESRRVEQLGKSHELFFAALERYKANGFEVTQDTVNRLAALYGIDAPVLAGAENAAVPLVWAPTSLEAFVLVKEARASQRLPPFGDTRDDMTVSAYKAMLDAQTASNNAPAAAQGGQSDAQ